jgi:hypothetical protein
LASVRPLSPQIERDHANPTIATLERTLRATGHHLDVRAVPFAPAVDVTLLQEALKMTPAERIETSVRLTRDAEKSTEANRRDQT